jgi:gliding motility-associated-like protein
VVIKQIAINEFECTDTLIKTLDLKIYLLLPNAFSPNGDLNNDGLSLIYKGIDELLEYRIYNRWGELVFDGENDLNAVWDGTYKGKEQPLGTYVYYVKAKDYHQEIITHSGKVTLIR